ncbi:hypothetical protein LWP59_16035 [Amycolatopsis acidiphila]|uniref:hypothetical protein n=1 Tax=Amycolatopsis acidiphila TaxID=715473 RepID=UPI001643866F|nr:hypothetical protein [Amycolatopsis acidiphila]UIJ63026.1 hypothetical protein LWP59_16035 [Amycolatopsis acidiphila]GHG65720.1 hypothetical protein GCM10017788_23390 [Amycolatopsis acidiphila]
MRVWQYPVNGYQAEWLHLADIANGLAEPDVPVKTAVEDPMFAVELADRGAELLLERL